jgi:hypothetical protein
VSGRLTWLSGAPLWAVFLAFLIGITLFLLLLIFYKRKDPDKAWIYKTILLIVAIGAIISIDEKFSDAVSRYLFNPEQQVRIWLDEFKFTSHAVTPPPTGEIFRIEAKDNVKGRNLAFYQEFKDPETLFAFTFLQTQEVLPRLSDHERSKLWLEMGLVLLRSDIRITPLQKYGPLEVLNAFSFKPKMTKQQFLSEVRRFMMALETVDVLLARGQPTTELKRLLSFAFLAFLLRFWIRFYERLYGLFKTQRRERNRLRFAFVLLHRLPGTVPIVCLDGEMAHAITPA